MTVQICVPYRPDTPERARAWAWCEARWQALYPTWPIVVGSCGDGNWNIAEALNDALRQATGDIVMLMGADVALNEVTVDLAVVAALDGRWVLPAGTLLRVSQGATTSLLSSTPGAPLSGSVAGIRQACGFGWGPIVAPTALLRAVGGWDERFRGHGGEDDAFAVCASTLAGPPVQLGHDVHLLWHPPAAVDQAQYAANLALLARYQAVQGDPVAVRALIAERHQCAPDGQAGIGGGQHL